MEVTCFVNPNEQRKYFILDSHDHGVLGQSGNSYDDEDYVQYSYRPAQNNRLAVGDAFLYRKPGKQFRIIGGGTIRAIVSHNNGYNTAQIANGFEFIAPINKGDPFLESFVWKKKTKPGPGWKGFWTNYGILEIEQEDYWGLVQYSKCKPAISISDQTRDALEDYNLIQDLLNVTVDQAEDRLGNAVPIPRPTPLNTHQTVYPRNRKTAVNALKKANFLCECGASHPSFVRRGTNTYYCEPHHLVPMRYQGAFENSLDREENIVSLCSNCHNQIHYGEGAKELITKLYSQRKEALEQIGITIDLATLLSMYDYYDTDY